YFNAFADSNVPFDLAGDNSASTNADANSNTNTKIEAGADITGSTSVTIKADILSGQFISHAKTRTTGLTGTLTSTATSNKAGYGALSQDGRRQQHGQEQGGCASGNRRRFGREDSDDGRRD